MMKIFMIVSIILMPLFSLTLNNRQCRNAKFIYNKTANKIFAYLLIALALKESSLDDRKINICDLRFKGRCYNSLNLFQTNLHTAKLLYPNISFKVLEKRLKKSRYFALKITKELFRSNAKMIKDNKYISERYIKDILKIYHRGKITKKSIYANELYELYLYLKKGIKCK